MQRLPFSSSYSPEKVAAWSLVLIGVVVFSNSLAGTFVFDDTAFLNDDYLSFNSAAWLISPAESPMKGRPLAGLTFLVNYAICGDRPVGYHLFNMLIHLACALALFGVVRRTLSLYRRQQETADPPVVTSETGVAFAVALLWMVHPLQTECVNYISQRTESMAGLFILLSLYGALRARCDEQKTSWTLLAGLASWLGVMSKEVAAVGPVLLVLHDLTFGGSSPRATLRQRWPVYLAVFSSWAPLAGFMYFLPRSATVGVTADGGIMQYALNQSVLIVEYLRLAFWPDALLIDYGKPWNVAPIEVVPCVVAVVSLLALTLAAYRRFPAVGYLGAWVFLLLAPTSSFVPINTEVGAERRMYLPLAAIVMLAVLGAQALVARCCRWLDRRAASPSFLRPWHNATPRGPSNQVLWRTAVLQSALLGVIVAALSVRTIDRNSDYANPLQLWTQAVERLPRNRRAWVNLAGEFRKVAPKTAALVLEEIIRRWPADAPIYYEVAIYHRYEGNFDRAVRYFRRVAELDPSCLEAQRRLVWLLAACDDDTVRNGKEALRIARTLHRQQPDSVEMQDALAVAYAECGDFSNATLAVEQAIECAQKRAGETSALEQRWKMFRQQRPFRFGHGHDK